MQWRWLHYAHTWRANLRPIDRYAYPDTRKEQFHTEDQMTMAG